MLGLWLLFWPDRMATRSKRAHVKRLQELEADAEESYFEERRALEAYRPARRRLWWRLAGATLLALGLAPLLLGN